MAEHRKSDGQNFLEGTALLAMATAIVKILGAVYKIPLNAIIGEQGFGYFNTAYEIYNILLMISTAGLPVAMSRMISQANSLQHYNQVRRIYATARNLFLGLGLVGSLLMTLFCRPLARFQNQPDAWAAIGFLGPCVLLICVISTFRGFFQGQGNMLPTSVSQVIEAVVRLFVGMAAALVLLRATGSVSLAAGGAILGVTASCLISSGYLFFCFHRHYKELPRSGDTPWSFRATARALLVIAVPITLGSACLQVITALASKIYMGQLLASGLSQQTADTMRGIHVMTQTIFNMPCGFITPITVSIIPAITAQITLGGHQKARQTEEAAARLTGLLAIPCAIGLTVLARPITALLGGYTGEKLELAAKLMSILGICVFFNALVLVTTAIMQAHGHVTRPVVHMALAGLVRLVAVYILSGDPAIGIVGAPISNLNCYAVIALLNLWALRGLLEDPPAIAKNVLRPLLSGLLMGAFSYGLWLLLTTLGVDSRLLLCGLPVAAGGITYAAAVVLLKVIRREDCLLLPKGEKIASILRL